MTLLRQTFALCVPCIGLLLLADRTDAQVLQHGVGSKAVTAVRSEAGLELNRHDGTPLARLAARGLELNDLATTNDSWVVAGSVGGERRQTIELRIGSRDRETVVISPRAQISRFRAEPVLLDGERIASGVAGGAVAWLEGPHPREAAVWISRWDGDALGAPELIAPSVGGTQTGLVAASLDDGTWMLAWSAFDGEDSELVFSTWDGTSWATPRRLHPDNRVPDITPALHSDGTGVLAVWSRYDGNDYRLAASRWSGDGWSPVRLTGVAGSLDPSFVRGADRPLLTYARAVPRRWVVAELGAYGETVRRASIARDSDRRPIVVDLGDSDSSGLSMRIEAEAGTSPRTIRRRWNVPSTRQRVRR